MDLKSITRENMDEMLSELVPLLEALESDGLDDYSETVQIVIQKINNLQTVLDNSDLGAKLSSI